MLRSIDRLLISVMLAASAIVPAGCGTTRSTDTSRTATEQLLISDAIDRAVQTMDLKGLSGQTVFLDDSRLSDVVDKNYLIGTLRQHLLASGCLLRDKREEADFIVEARSGGVGTDRNDLLFGVPSMNVPQIVPMQPVPAAIPEIPIAKRKNQRGIAKLALFVYHRPSGTPVYQSGLVLQESSSNDVWILGAGPFQRGTIHTGTAFAGKTIRIEDEDDEAAPRRLPPVDLARETTFTPPHRLAEHKPAAIESQEVVQAAHQELGRASASSGSNDDSPAPVTPPASTAVGADAQQKSVYGPMASPLR